MSRTHKTTSYNQFYAYSPLVEAPHGGIMLSWSPSVAWQPRLGIVIQFENDAFNRH